MDKPGANKLPTPIERLELLRRCLEDRDKPACSVLNGTGVIDGVKDDPKLTGECPMLKKSGIKLLDLTWSQAQNLPKRCPDLFQDPLPIPSIGKMSMAPIIGIGAVAVLSYFLLKEK
tara:strand:- start:1022 stop:1372 length:351 start_codon:yes stop_codon:yes gene_type:complete